MENSVKVSVVQAIRSRILATTFLGLFIGFFCSYSTYACSCARTIEIDEELKISEVIFSGKAIRVDTSIDGKATFEVTKVWRGEVASFVDTAILYGCMDTFHTGEEYLVFARKIHGENHFAAELRANSCGETRQIKYSQNALSALGEGTPPKRNYILSLMWFIKLHKPIQLALALLVVLIVLLSVRLLIASKQIDEASS